MPPKKRTASSIREEEKQTREDVSRHIVGAARRSSSSISKPWSKDIGREFASYLRQDADILIPQTQAKISSARSRIEKGVKQHKTLTQLQHEIDYVRNMESTLKTYKKRKQLTSEQIFMLADTEYPNWWDDNPPPPPPGGGPGPGSSGGAIGVS